MSPLELTCLTFLDRAVGAPFGIVVEVLEAGPELTVTPALRAKQVLYRMRKELDNPLYANIKFELDPDAPDQRLWLLNMAEPDVA